MSWRVTSGSYAPQTVERLLRALPQWFGIESSNAAYVEEARRLPACLAWPATNTRACPAELPPPTRAMSSPAQSCPSIGEAQ